MAMDRSLDIGRLGEKAAEKYCKRAGYLIVDRNYHCPLGEIDLIALDDEELVFIEVKSRQSDEAADPEDQVNRQKQRKLRLAARYYLHSARAEDQPCRFDVVAVVTTGRGYPEIRHYKDAF